jgi:hypothetical protein
VPFDFTMASPPHELKPDQLTGDAKARHSRVSLSPGSGFVCVLVVTTRACPWAAAARVVLNGGRLGLGNQVVT